MKQDPIEEQKDTRTLMVACDLINNGYYANWTDIMQLINLGFNPLRVISEKTGEDIQQLKKKAQNGEVSPVDIFGAILTKLKKN